MLVLLAAGSNLGRAQQAGTNTVTAANSSVTLHKASTAKAQESTPTLLQLGAPRDTNSMQLQVSKETQLNFSGPLIQPLKAKTASGFAGRVAHWVNPFSTNQPNVPPAPSGPVNTRAWNTIVGWSPGHSAFPSAGNWDEPPHLDLITVTAQKQP